MAGRAWRPSDPVGRRGAAPRPGDPVAIGSPLDRVLDALGAPPADALGSLFERWDELVGEPLAEHGKPAALDDGVLVVRVTEPAWATEWRYRQGEVLRRLDEVLGAGVVARIDVRVRRS